MYKKIIIQNNMNGDFQYLEDTRGVHNASKVDINIISKDRYHEDVFFF